MMSLVQLWPSPFWLVSTPGGNWAGPIYFCHLPESEASSLSVNPLHPNSANLKLEYLNHRVSVTLASCFTPPDPVMHESFCVGFLGVS